MQKQTTYSKFIFERFAFDAITRTALFEYSFDGDRRFTETVEFASVKEGYDHSALESALFYAWITAGTSYYKLFPGAEFDLGEHTLTQQQADFFSGLYRGGLSQFIYENQLKPEIIPSFTASSDAHATASDSDYKGVLLLQSGGKDSLLAASLLAETKTDFDAWHMSSMGHHPGIIEDIGAQSVVDAKRTIDLPAIKAAQADGGLNGHVPFSAITAGYALIEAILTGKQYIIAAMESSSDEGNTFIGDFEVNHMYSKTYNFELSLNEYIHANIAKNITYLSVIRPFSDLRVAELFAEKTWPHVQGHFASCNIANYKQGQDDGQLTWCGNCSKCANSYLLFAPFVAYDELVEIFDGQNLLKKPSLRRDFLALLGIDGVKPFECVGTVDELRAAYHMACANDVRLCMDDASIPRPEGDFQGLSDYQPQIAEFIPAELLES